MANRFANQLQRHMLQTIRRLWDHLQWADRKILDQIRDDEVTPAILHEFAHVIGAEETWLARLERRDPRAGVWPDVSLEELVDLAEATHRGYATYLSALTDAKLAEAVTYTNSAGKEFTNEVVDVLLHVALHGQYHRGKVNLMLRQTGGAPAPTDYIAYVRGAPAATRATADYGSID